MLGKDLGRTLLRKAAECMTLSLNFCCRAVRGADAVLQWVVREVGPDALKDPDTAKQLTLAVLRHAIPNPKVQIFIDRHSL